MFVLLPRWRSVVMGTVSRLWLGVQVTDNSIQPQRW